VKKIHDQTASVISLRATLLEVVATAICIALGIHCVAIGLALQLGWPGWALIVLGACLSAGGSVYLAARAAPRINGEFSFQGVLPVKGKEHDVIAINRYRFAEKAAGYFRGLTAENKALAKAWSDNPLTTFDFDRKEGRASRRSSPAVKLVQEAVEYFVLDELSLHLSGYFVNNPKVDNQELTKIGRREIPSVLLENHFLELFSKPMEEREAFLLSSRGKRIEVHDGHNVVLATGKGGALFDHFELILPRGTTVSRMDPRSIQLKTDRFSMRIVVGFEGFSSVLPRNFERLYLGYDFRDIHAYQVDPERQADAKAPVVCTEGVLPPELSSLTLRDVCTRRDQICEQCSSECPDTAAKQ
jgi:hypothetical protein